MDARTTPPNPRNSADTRARIVAVAQQVFSDKGYSHANLREIAKAAGVAPSLLIKYFATKAGLFEEALASSILPLQTFQADRTRFGETLVNAVLDPQASMSAPAMIALSLGDPESREVATRVVQERILDPMAGWLGAGEAQARAVVLVMMTTGLAIIGRNMGHAIETGPGSEAARIFARSLQAIADEAGAG